MGKFKLGTKYTVYGNETIYDGEVGALYYFRSTSEPGLTYKIFPQDADTSIEEIKEDTAKPKAAK